MSTTTADRISSAHRPPSAPRRYKAMRRPKPVPCGSISCSGRPTPACTSRSSIRRAPVLWPAMWSNCSRPAPTPWCRPGSSTRRPAGAASTPPITSISPALIPPRNTTWWSTPTTTPRPTVPWLTATSSSVLARLAGAATMCSMPPWAACRRWTAMPRRAAALSSPSATAAMAMAAMPATSVSSAPATTTALLPMPTTPPTPIWARSGSTPSTPSWLAPASSSTCPLWWTAAAWWTGRCRRTTPLSRWRVAASVWTCCAASRI
ncbi:hypothetical protein D3C85_962730 [compost metagenome]